MDKHHVLVVDNEPEICQLIQLHLHNEHFDVCIAHSGSEAIHSLKREKIDLLVLDLMMENMNGWDVLQHIRSKQLDVAVIILSARHVVEDKINSLKLGADDYLTKPFSPGELIARIHAVLRRCKPMTNDSHMRCGSFLYDRTTQLLEKPSGTVSLSPIEGLMLELFMLQVGQVITKEDLFKYAWKLDQFDPNSLNVYINFLRKKIEDDPSNPRYIQTIRGVGYRFVGENQA